MPDEIAKAYVKITPDLTGFRDELRAGLDQETAGMDKTVRIDADTADADYKIEVTGAKLDKLSTETATAHADVDDRTALLKLDELRARIDEMKAEAAIAKVGVDDSGARRTLTDIQDALLDVENETLRLRPIDDAELERMSSELDTLDSKLKDTQSDLDKTSSSADRTAKSLGGGGGGGAGLLGAVLPLIPALDTIGIVGVGGLLGIANAGAAATLGLGAFALAAEGDMATVENQAKGLLNTWQLTTAGFVDPVLNNALAGLPSLFNFLTPSVATASSALQGLQADMKAAFASPSLQYFSNFVAGEGGSAITDFGHLLGGLGHAWEGFAEGFAPEIAQIDNDLVRWGQDLTKWGNEARNGAFSGLLTYIQQNGPLVAHTFEQLGSTFVTVAKDAAPLGPITLKIVDATAELLNDILQLNPTLTTWALGLAGVAYSANRLLGAGGFGGLIPVARSLPGILGSIGDAAALGSAGVYSVATAAGGGVGALATFGATTLATVPGLDILGAALLANTGLFSHFSDSVAEASKTWAQQFVDQIPAGTNAVAAVNAEISTLNDQFGQQSKLVAQLQQNTGLFTTSIQDLPPQLRSLGNALINDGFQPTTKLGDAYDAIVNGPLDEYGTRIDTLTKLLPGLQRAQDAQTQATDAAAIATGQAAGYTGDYALKYGLLTSQLVAANQQLTQTETLLNSMLSASLNAEQATTSFYAAIQAFTTALHTNGTSLDVTTAKGLANRQAFDAVATAVNSTIQAMEKQGSTSDQIVAKVQSLTSYIEQQAGKYGLTKSQVDQYLHSLGLTPAQVKTDLELSGYQTASSNLTGLQKQIAALPKSVTIAVNTILSTSIPGHPGKGNILPGYATGTPSAPGGWTNIAEAGSEAVIAPGMGPVLVKNKSLMDLPAGTQVMSHQDTMRSFPGLATGDTTVEQLAFPSSLTLNPSYTVTITGADLANSVALQKTIRAALSAHDAELLQLIGANRGIK